MYTGKQEAAKDQVFVHKYLIGCDKRMRAFHSMFTFKIAVANSMQLPVWITEEHWISYKGEKIDLVWKSEKDIYNRSNMKVHLQHLGLSTYMIQMIYDTEWEIPVDLQSSSLSI